MHQRTLKNLLFCCVFVFALSCETQTVYSEYYQLDNGVWKVGDTIQFKFSEVDTLEKYNMFINIRNDNDFAYSNLFLITEFGYPNGEVVSDTLEYRMAMPDGTWLGKGIGSIKESKLWYRENIVFPDSGVYKLKVTHAMRQNGNVEGISNLNGLTDIGVEITKSTE
ncbi:gliding motility lipoprotein GldH [uncultured Croceitalea sp.]|uniref:gliding motility lipoprotein GldH n=1 Tax=uncultured Croceitalea sp. TaxID=1798908 RepID=UPI00374F3F34